MAVLVAIDPEARVDWAERRQAFVPRRSLRRSQGAAYLPKRPSKHLLLGASLSF